MLTFLFLKIFKCTDPFDFLIVDHYKDNLNTDFQIYDIDLPLISTDDALNKGFTVKVDKKLRNIGAHDFVRNYNVFIQTGKGTYCSEIRKNKPRKLEIEILSSKKISVVFPLDYLFEQNYLNTYFEKFDGTDRRETQEYVLINGYQFLKFYDFE